MFVISVPAVLQTLVHGDTPVRVRIFVHWCWCITGSDRVFPISIGSVVSLHPRKFPTLPSYFIHKCVSHSPHMSFVLCPITPVCS